MTIQAQILDLLRSLQKERGMALVMITHNMGVVSEMAQRVAVVYAGQIMEERSAQTIFAVPQHPYTEALLAAMPERSDGFSRLATIPGMVPDCMTALLAACSRPGATTPTTVAGRNAPHCALGKTAWCDATTRWLTLIKATLNQLLP